MKRTLFGITAILAAGLLFFACSGTTSSGGGGDEHSGPVSGGGGNVDNPENGGGGAGTVQTPTAADVSNAQVKIVKSDGLFNSAYIIFEQVEGAVYEVLADDVKIDEALIRYYDEYVYHEYDEANSTWTKKSLTKVCRADALGLTAGSHTLKVCAVGTQSKSDYSSATMTVADKDRSGFAFTGSSIPGAYASDGTLKSNAIVLYVTGATAKTVSYTQVKGTNATADATYTGLQNILSEASLKKLSVPLCIRIIGTITKAQMDSLGSSAEGLQIKSTTEYGITIEGVGHDAAVYGFGFLIRAAKYVELCNLGVYNFMDDGISVDTDNSYLWIHNNDISYGAVGSDSDQAKGDGSLDFKKSTYSTLSYNHFWDSGKCNLLDASADSNGSNYLSYHHNWYDHSDSRHPRIRNATAVHVYNNYYDGNSKYGIGVTSGSSCFAESNYFRNAHDPMMSSKQGTDGQGDGTFSGEEGGTIKAYGNKFVGNNTNGVKFQFVTNKYDYTNGKSVSEPTTVTETLGTVNGDGTWTIYSWAYGESFPAFIVTDNATDKGASDATKPYYQISKGKKGFTLTVPANATKVVIKAKSGSSDVSSAKLTVGSVSGTVSDADYTDCEFDVSGLTDTSFAVTAGSEGSINVKAITVYAATGWETTYTTGVSLSDIDAYEVDSRDAVVPDTVKTKSGSHTYSNFDTKLGLSGLGLAAVPSNAETAKSYVVKYAGRYQSDFAYNFDNAADDADYGVNSALKALVVNYENKLTAVQGLASSGSGGSTGGDSGSTGSGESTGSGTSDPVSGGTTDSGSTDVPTGSAVVALVVNGAVAPSDSRVTAVGSVNAKESNGAITITYDGIEYTTMKMESSSSITVKATVGATITVVGSLPSGKQSCFKLNGTAVKLSAKTTAVTTFEQTFTATGNDVITKGDTASIGVIVISE